MIERMLLNLRLLLRTIRNNHPIRNILTSGIPFQHHIGCLHHVVSLPLIMATRHEIILIESFSVNEEEDLEITAVLENVTKRIGSNEPPRFAPVRAVATVFKELLPYGTEFAGKRPDELEELVNRHNLLCNQQWKIIGVEPKANNPNRFGRLFF